MKRFLAIAAFLMLARAAAWSEDPGKPGRKAPAPRTQAATKASPAASEKEEASFRSAMSTIESARETSKLTQAMEVLRKGFPASRAVLHEFASKGSAKTQCFAIQVLGEHGTEEEDLAVVIKGLDSPWPKARLATVMAVRRLGKGALEALVAYIPREKEAGNRKMAVKTLQNWRSPAALPHLVRLLKGEKDPGVRNFIVCALEFLSLNKLGDDVDAWEAYLNNEALREQTRALTSTGKPPAGAANGAGGEK